MLKVYIYFLSEETLITNKQNGVLNLQGCKEIKLILYGEELVSMNLVLKMNRK